MDEQTSDVLVRYTVKAVRKCDTWTHSDILLALSTVVYGNGSQCLQVRTHVYDLRESASQHVMTACE